MYKLIAYMYNGFGLTVRFLGVSLLNSYTTLNIKLPNELKLTHLKKIFQNVSL